MNDRARRYTLKVSRIPGRVLPRNLVPHTSAALNPSRWAFSVLVVFTMFGFGFGNWLARLPAIRDHLGASTIEMSIIGLSIAIGAVAGLLFAGHSVTWLGPRRAILVTVLGQVVFIAVGGPLLWAGHLVPSLIVLALFGFCFSTGDVAMNVSGAAAERALGKSRMPILHGGYSLGGVVAMGTGALAEYFKISVPTHLMLVFALILVCVLLALRNIPRVEPITHGAPDPHLEQVINTNTGPMHVVTPELTAAAISKPQPAARYNPWRDKRIVIIGLVVLSMGLTEGTATDWLPLALADHRGFTNSTAALVLGVFFTAMMLTRMTGGWLLDRFGRVAVLRGGAVLVAISIILINAVPFAWASVTAAVLWGVGCALGFPIGVSAAADNPATAVRAVATVSAIAYGSYLLGPMAIGFLGQSFGLLTAFLPLLVFLVFVFFAAGAARESGRRISA